MKRLTATILAALALLAASTRGSDIPVAVIGKRGAPLYDAIGQSYRPQTLYRGDAYEIARRLDAIGPEGLMLINRFDPASPLVVADARWITAHVMAPRWWNSTPRAYGDSLGADLHNLIAVGEECNFMGTLPPGDIAPAPDGSGHAGETPEGAACYTPAADYRGDIARAIFYLATIFPADVWDIDGALIFNWPGSFPVFNGYGESLLLKWHHEDPVSADELERCAMIEAIQGNRNPFVDDPALAEYLWGRHSGEPYLPEGVDAPLRGTYRLSDGEVGLWSPYIPADATWTIDGTPADGRRIDLHSIGTGVHTLHFTSPSATGTVKINVTQ